MEERISALETSTMGELRTEVTAKVRELEEKMQAHRDDDRRYFKSQIEGVHSIMEENNTEMENKLKEGLEKVEKEIQEMQKIQIEGLKSGQESLKGGQQEVERIIR